MKSEIHEKPPAMDEKLEAEKTAAGKMEELEVIQKDGDSSGL